MGGNSLLVSFKCKHIARFPIQLLRRITISGGSRGGSGVQTIGGSNEPPLEPKLFHFRGEFQEKLVKLHKSNPRQLIWTPDPKILDPALTITCIWNWFLLKTIGNANCAEFKEARETFVQKKHVSCYKYQFYN